MFENLRESFRQAIENFKTELHRDEVPETVDELLRAMRREVTDVQAAARKLDEDIRASLKKAEAEGKEAETCRRREEMAEKIGDGETARLAREYAEKHEGRKAVLEKKALALKEELDLRRSEVAEMIEQIKGAQANRDALAAKLGRSQARDAIRDADDLFSELDRMAETIDDAERRRDAREEVDQALGDELGGAPPAGGDELDELEVEARLEELKRQMGR